MPTVTRPRAHTLLAGLTALLSALAPASTAAAQESDAAVGWKTRRVIVLPVMSWVRGPEDVFTERPAVRRLRESSGLWQRRLEALLERRELVERVSTVELREQLRLQQAQRESAVLAGERFSLGLEQYRLLRVTEALEQLDRAAALYRQADAGSGSFVRELADVELYRGLSLLEKGDANLAHMAFRSMWLLDPGRTFEQGYYTQATEQALAGALADLSALPDRLLARTQPDQLRALSAETGIDSWFMASIVGSVDAPSLRVIAFDADRGTHGLDETVSLASDAAALDLLERALSAWHTCVIEDQADPFVRPRALPRWYLEVGYTHSVWLLHDKTREFFHSPGATVALTWEVVEFAHVFAAATQMGSIPDDNGDLLGPFVNSRLMVGGGLTAGLPNLRFFVRAAVEMSLSFQTITATRDVDCKHFGTSHPRCDNSRLFVDGAPGLWIGVTFGIGLRWVFHQDWYLLTSAELASYVAEEELIDDLNFPASLTLGFGRRF